MSITFHSRPALGWLAALSLGAVALLAGCDRDEERAASARPDAAKSAANDVRQQAREAGDAVTNKAKDVTITTEIKTLLGRDNQLNALKIDVDTNAGQVVLQGTAPDEAARSRASDLARSVGGVLGVENKLQVTAAN